MLFYYYFTIYYQKFVFFIFSKIQHIFKRDFFAYTLSLNIYLYILML
jgi:hypothetical protein